MKLNRRIGPSASLFRELDDLNERNRRCCAQIDQLPPWLVAGKMRGALFPSLINDRDDFAIMVTDRLGWSTQDKLDPLTLKDWRARDLDLSEYRIKVEELERLAAYWLDINERVQAAMADHNTPPPVEESCERLIAVMRKLSSVAGWCDAHSKTAHDQGWLGDVPGVNLLEAESLAAGEIAGISRVIHEQLAELSPYARLNITRIKNGIESSATRAGSGRYPELTARQREQKQVEYASRYARTQLQLIADDAEAVLAVVSSSISELVPRMRALQVEEADHPAAAPF